MSTEVSKKRHSHRKRARQGPEDVPAVHAPRKSLAAQLQAVRKAAVGMLMYYPVWSLRLPHCIDMGFADTYTRFALTAAARETLPDSERVVTWVPRLGEPFLYFVVFFPRVPAPAGGGGGDAGWTDESE
eukprot:58819-Rhodomonas_salina.3